ncbi:RNA methyltransferase [Nonomuraea sp. WAC 01424]|uniref:TRM11 family SAM-dependent methyltransferase n=1 Tax=Nonomuraea sp. WAC 01424 TaxID=2203200 RepID=UPI000F7A3C5C|nr:DNA methyltransferase [Nonomuraea sp. WAC 01424]RSN08329.1 RNA methyltransferase [Nonomuraea sp. WAC 01424]
MSEGVLPSVLATGQLQSRVQRRDRYVPESMRHPGKMLPSIASHVISAFTEPGDLVVDPMCGIGTTLVEAVHLGRHAAGMEYEADFAGLTAANVQHARCQGATGYGRVACGDARNVATVFGDLQGLAALVLTSPPYGVRTHGHVRCGSREGGGPVRKSNHRYSTDKGNLAHQRLPQLMEGFGKILAECGGLLRPRGVVAITIRPIRVGGRLVDLPGQVIETAEAAGFQLTHRMAALLCGLRDGHLINRASFFQMLEAWRAQEKGQPVCAAAHEDLLILRVREEFSNSRP